MQPMLIILIGNIGSGKTTACKEFSKQEFYIVSRDSMRDMLGGNKYVFTSITELAIEQAVIAMVNKLLQEGVNIVIDETNMTKKIRKRYIKLGKKYGYKIIAHETPKFSKDKCIANRQKDSLRGYDNKTWGIIWEGFNKRYQEPTYDEGFDIIETGDDGDTL